MIKMKKSDTLFWIIVLLIFIISIADYLVPQLPALSISEAFFEGVTIVSIVILGAAKILKKL